MTAVVMFVHLIAKSIIAVEDMDLPVGGGNGTSTCTSDWLAVESCVPEGGSRFCGTESGATCNYEYLLSKIIN